jgi:hypothetical protein
LNLLCLLCAVHPSKNQNKRENQAPPSFLNSQISNPNKFALVPPSSIALGSTPIISGKTETTNLIVQQVRDHYNEHQQKHYKQQQQSEGGGEEEVQSHHRQKPHLRENSGAGTGGGRKVRKHKILAQRDEDGGGGLKENSRNEENRRLLRRNLQEEANAAATAVHENQDSSEVDRLQQSINSLTDSSSSSSSSSAVKLNRIKRNKAIGSSAADASSGSSSSLKGNNKSKYHKLKKGGRIKSLLSGGNTNPKELSNKNKAARERLIDKIIVESDRYHMWWTGPLPESTFSDVSSTVYDLSSTYFFLPEKWSVNHISTNNAVFTVVFGEEPASLPSSSTSQQQQKRSLRRNLQEEQQHPLHQPICSSPNNLILYLGSLRKVYSEDIVIAIDKTFFLSFPVIKTILIYYKVIVYLLPSDLCNNKDTATTGNGNGNVIFCGSTEERVPITSFRYNFYEKWLIHYNETSKILISDFRDVFFQENPFSLKYTSLWFPKYSLAVSEEFYPNMRIGGCSLNSKYLQECYGNELLKQFQNDVIISSGAMIGTRDGLLIWSNTLTKVSFLSAFLVLVSLSLNVFFFSSCFLSSLLFVLFLLFAFFIAITRCTGKNGRNPLLFGWN